MTSPLTHEEFTELCQQSMRQKELIFNSDGFDYIENLEHQFAKEHSRSVQLRPELRLEIFDDYHYRDRSLQTNHDDYNVLVSKFYSLGHQRTLTPNVPNIKDDYIEEAGYNYLFFLPDIQETEQFFANQRLHVVRIEVDPNLLIADSAEDKLLPLELRRLSEGKLDQRFHQSIGRTTAMMQAVLQQLLNCPYQGITKRIYLESKVLELLALQMNQWAETSTPRSEQSQRSLQPHDIERLYYAKEILIQNLHNPPSLIDLARQVGLNDYKLKYGFRQVFGNTVFGYLKTYRMKQAQTLLAEPHISIAGIAQQVGYASQSRFCDAFKQQFGMSPRAYRMSLRG